MINRSGKLKERISFLFIVFLVFFLVGCGSAPEVKTAQPVSAEMIANANVENGRDLFMGYAHFEHEGPPCMGCHSVGENGLLGGGALGPDLTNVSTQRSEAEILGILSNTGTVTSPVMQPIYVTDPLTAEEKADLLAFMKSSIGQPESDKELLVLGISIVGFFGAVGALGFVYRNRLRSIRRVLVNKAQKELL